MFRGNGARPEWAPTLAAISHQFSAADANLLALAGRTPSSRFDVVSATCCATLSLLRLQAGASHPGLPARRDEVPPALRLCPARPSASLGPCDPLSRHLGALATIIGAILRLAQLSRQDLGRDPQFDCSSTIELCSRNLQSEVSAPSPTLIDCGLSAFSSERTRRAAPRARLPRRWASPHPASRSTSLRFTPRGS